MADTGPINYLILIGHIEILPALFETVILPSIVRDELSHPKAPPLVRSWIAQPEAWLTIHRSKGSVDDEAIKKLDAGESDAIILALELHADLLLMDDREGVAVALRKGFRVAGTLGILRMGSDRGLLDLGDAFERLKRTNFRCRQEVFDQFLKGSYDPM